MASAARRSPHFFKVFMPRLSSHHLAIPRAFSKHMEDAEPPRAVSLVGPSGRAWRADLVKEGGGVALEGGWRDFVADHSLALGDFLVFRYDGGSQFTVLVFDPSACEKEGAFRAVPHERVILAVDSEEEEEEEEDVEASKSIVVFQQEARRAPRKRKGGCIYTRVTRSKSNSYEHTTLHSEDKMSMRGKTRAIGTNKKRASERLALIQYKQSEEAPSVQVPRTLASQRRQVTVEELNRALERAKSFKSKNPFATVVMKESSVYFCFYLHFPLDFVKTHLPRFNTKITLWDPDGRPWICTYIKRGGLSGGWGKFSVTNNLEKGDVCIFELIQRDQMQVHIFRVVKKRTPLVKNLHKSNA